MKLKTILSLTLVLTLNYMALSQEGLPIYSDYLTDNYYLLHPSMAGASNCGKVRLTGRQLWFGQEDAPRLMTLNAHSKIGDTPSAIGGILFVDRNGYHSQTSGLFTYAHHIMFSRSTVDLNMLSFGLSGGFIQYRLDETDFNPLQDNSIDKLIQGGITSKTHFNADFGVSYQFLDVYFHGTVKNLVKNSGINNNMNITSNLRRYLFSFGGVISPFGSEWSIEPSLMYQYRDGSKESSIDLNLKGYKDMDFGKVWGGLSYRGSFDGLEEVNVITGNAYTQKLRNLTPFFGVNYNEYMFAYTYSYEAQKLKFHPGGFHQITLGYNFNCRKQPYDCKCPAVN